MLKKRLAKWRSRFFNSFNPGKKILDDLSGLNFRGVTLDNFDLSFCKIDQSVLTECSLKNANFEHSSLRECDLRSANMKNANFRNTDLKGANLSSVKAWDSVDFTHSVIDDETKLPFGIGTAIAKQIRFDKGGNINGQ